MSLFTLGEIAAFVVGAALLGSALGLVLGARRARRQLADEYLRFDSERQARINELERDVLRWRKAAANAEVEYFRDSSESERLREATTSLRQQVEQLETQRDDLAAEIRSLEARIQDRDGRLTLLARQVAASQSASEQLDALRGELNAARTRIGELEQQATSGAAATLRADFERQIAERDERISSLEAALAESNQLRATVASLRSELNQRTKDLAEFRNSNTSTRSAWTELSGGADDRIQELEAELAEYRFQAESAEDLALAVARLKQQLEQRSARILELERRLAANTQPAEPARPASDDLTRIEGINGLLAVKLGNLGYRRYADIAALTDAAISTLAPLLGIEPEVVRSNKWIEQAAWLDRASRQEPASDHPT